MVSNLISLDIFGSESPDADPETKGLLGNLASSVTSKLTGATTLVTSLYNRNYKYFILTMGAGCALVVISLMFLPLVMLFPQKFCLFFSLGSLCILSSFAFLQDPADYLRSFFSGPQALFGICYLGSLLLSVYASLVAKRYLATIVVTVLQVSVKSAIQ